MSTRDLLAPLVKLIVLSVPASAQNFMFGPFIPIFMLHRMDCPDLKLKGHNPQLLKEMLELLRKNKFNFISLEEASTYLTSNTKPPSRSIVFTMDDGFFDHYEIAAPIFDQYDCPATFFLVTDFINQKLWPWDDQIAYIVENCIKETICLPEPMPGIYQLDNEKNRKSTTRLIIEQFKAESNTTLYQKLAELYIAADVTPPACTPEKHRPMSWENARTLIRNGHSIGAHTKTHRILSRLTDDESRNEIIDSINEVKKQTGESSVFAYPTGRPGDFGEREIATLQHTCIKTAVTTTHMSAMPPKSARENYLVPRFSLPENTLDLLQYSSWLEVFKNNIRSRKSMN